MGATLLVNNGTGGTCAQCGAPPEAGAGFCIACGAPVQQAGAGSAQQAGAPVGAAMRAGVPAPRRTGTPLISPTGGVGAGGVCANCGCPIDSEAMFCVQCGHPVGGGSPAGARCPHCGLELEPGAMFCIGCGKPVGQGAEQGSWQETGRGAGFGDAQHADGGARVVPADEGMADDDDATARPKLVMLTRDEARTGCRKTVNVDGQLVEVSIPAGVDVNTKLDVPGYGRFDEFTGERGPLRLTFYIS